MASAYKTLSRSEQWDDWIDQTRLYMEQLELWRFMDTERVFGLGESRPKEPTEPLLPSYDEALEARCAETPTDAQKKILYRLELHKTFGATYDSFLKRKEKAIKYLTTYVDARWQHVLSGCSTLLEKMQALEENVAPKLETRKNTLRLKFASMQKGKPSNIISVPQTPWGGTYLGTCAGGVIGPIREKVTRYIVPAPGSLRANGRIHYVGAKCYSEDQRINYIDCGNVACT